MIPKEFSWYRIERVTSLGLVLLTEDYPTDAVEMALLGVSSDAGETRSRELDEYREQILRLARDGRVQKLLSFMET